MSAEMRQSVRSNRDGRQSLDDLTPKHFAAAEGVADRKCLELPVVCEVWLSGRDRALIVPWVRCDRAPSGLFAFPSSTAPDIISFHPLSTDELIAVRRVLHWARLVDVLCDRLLHPRETAAVLDTFAKLHGLAPLRIRDFADWRARSELASARPETILQAAIQAVTVGQLGMDSR